MPGQPLGPGYPGAPVDTRPEDVERGTWFALIVLPLGIIVWVLVWQLGFIASIISFGIAWGAVRLYRLGARRITSTRGVWRVVVIVAVTVVLALFAGFAWDVLSYYEQNGIGWTSAITMSGFWRDTFAWMFDSQNVPHLLIAIAFAVLGCFTTLRSLVRSARAAQATAAQASTGPDFPPMEQLPPQPPQSPQP